MLQVQPFRDGFLNILGTLHRFGDGACKGKIALGRHRHVRQRRQRLAGVGDHLAHLARGFGIGVEHRDVPAVQQEPRGPTAADNPTTNDCCFSGHVFIPNAGGQRPPVLIYAKTDLLAVFHHDVIAAKLRADR